MTNQLRSWSSEKWFVCEMEEGVRVAVLMDELGGLDLSNDEALDFACKIVLATDEDDYTSLLS